MSQIIQVPFGFSPREYQLDFLKATQRFKILVIHRRGGKSMTAINEQIRKTQLKKGIYYYLLPTYAQAKKVIWDELVKNHVPMALVDKLNASELCIYWKNGSIQRFVGCEDIDKLRGINPIDVVFDEFSEMNPDVWTAIIQPVLQENGGSATFCFNEPHASSLQNHRAGPRPCTRIAQTRLHGRTRLGRASEKPIRHHRFTRPASRRVFTARHIGSRR